ncbi:4621_t:CDS:2, partial [Acaulospora morrowiae]
MGFTLIVKRSNVQCITRTNPLHIVCFNSKRHVISNRRTLNEKQRIERNYNTVINSQESTSRKSQNTQTRRTPSPQSSPIPSEILRASLQFVPEYGWSVESLSHGANSLGFPSVSHGLFPRGGLDLIDYFLEDSRRKMVSELNNKMDGLRIPQKIMLACETRLNFTKPYIKKWPEALALMSHPAYVPMSVEHLAKLVDDMWYLAGDKSADVKCSPSIIYRIVSMFGSARKKSTCETILNNLELYMTQDLSPDYIGTRQFLSRRLQDIATFGKTVNEINTFVEFTTRSFIGILASKGIGRF